MVKILFGKSKNDEKEDPKAIFLQQLGRIIRSIDPNEEDVQIPFVFDMACNFMRFNEKLNNIFIISSNQVEFRKLYEDSLLHGVSNRDSKNDKLQNIEKIIDVLQALSENNIDVFNITPETTWEDLEQTMDDETLNNVLDDIYAITQDRIKPNYEIGKMLELARKAFWHEETKNTNGVGIKKYYSTTTDDFFSSKSFEELYRIGLFRDRTRIQNKVNEIGFITKDCANLDKFYGFNIFTGTKYTDIDKTKGVPEQDVRGFGKNGIHVITQTRYDTRFFRFDSESGTWINLHTGKDEDLLGYNHDGIRVSDIYGRKEFDREGLWHRRLEDGSFSKIGQQYDDKGYDVHGFDINGRSETGSIFINGFDYKGRFKGIDGKYFDSKVGAEYNIDGYDEYGFNEDGINKETSCQYNKSGQSRVEINCLARPESPFPLRDILEGRYGNQFSNNRREEENEKKLIEWTIISRAHKGIKKMNWYKVLIIKYFERKGVDVDKEIFNRCKELQDVMVIQNQDLIKVSEKLDDDIKLNQKEIQVQEEEKKKLIQARDKMISVLRGIAGKGIQGEDKNDR